MAALEGLGALSRRRVGPPMPRSARASRARRPQRKREKKPAAPTETDRTTRCRSEGSGEGGEFLRLLRKGSSKQAPYCTVHGLQLPIPPHHGTAPCVRPLCGGRASTTQGRCETPVSRHKCARRTAKTCAPRGSGRGYRQSECCWCALYRPPCSAPFRWAETGRTRGLMASIRGSVPARTRMSQSRFLGPWIVRCCDRKRSNSTSLPACQRCVGAKRRPTDRSSIQGYIVKVLARTLGAPR